MRSRGGGGEESEERERETKAIRIVDICVDTQATGRVGGGTRGGTTPFLRCPAGSAR